MDKLELDDRVARLERRVSGQSALLALVLAAALGAAILMVAGFSTVHVASPATAVEVRTVTTSTPAAFPFEAELRKARKLQLDGLITQQDFEAKKEIILGMPMTFSDDAEAMKAANALKGEGILTGPEYDTMKRKILKLGL